MVEWVVENSIITQPILQSVLPSHLWIGLDGYIYHIDQYLQFDQTQFGKKGNLMQTKIHASTGSIVQTAKNKLPPTDVLHVVLYKKHVRWQAFFKFLERTGGDVEGYMEKIIFITGINPWNKI